MRALPNCARSDFKSTSRTVEPLASQDAGGFCVPRRGERFQIIAGDDLSTTGKVKFFNETKGYTPTGVAIDHPVARALLVSTSMDFGLVSETAGTDDDFGTPPSLFVELDVDLGNA